MSACMREWQLEQDRRLMQFNTYEHYLDSLVARRDMLYLRGAEPRVLAELGFRSAGETLTRAQFLQRQLAVTESMYPTRSQYLEDNAGIVITEPLFRELARRERANRVGVLATIIHVHVVSPLGYELSGYIDYADRLARERWGGPYFRGERTLLPGKSDLAFYHWRMDMSTCKSSLNFKVMPDPRRGLVFKHRKDRLQINVDPAFPAGPNTGRTRVLSPKYMSSVIYDHVVRQRC